MSTQLTPNSQNVIRGATVTRLLLGVVFFVFGLNGFLHFLPTPPLGAHAGAFMGALAATGYMFPLIKGTEVLAGALLLGNRFVPLAITLLAPVIVNIVAFHTFLAPGNYGLLAFIVAAPIFLAWVHRDVFRGMLRSSHKLTVGEAAPQSRHQPAAV